VVPFYSALVGNFWSALDIDVTNAAFGRLNPVQGNLPRFLKLGLNLQF
jgi:hypothetical protein